MPSTLEKGEARRHEGCMAGSLEGKDSNISALFLDSPPTPEEGEAGRRGWGRGKPLTMTLPLHASGKGVVLLPPPPMRGGAGSRVVTGLVTL
jgi:hypothetical protein